jgi:polar amino acid transport system substrate-binding protein
MDPTLSEKIAGILAPTGVLRAGVNLSNFLLVTGRNDDGAPAGVSPDVGALVADRLNVPVQYVTFPSPGEVADAAAEDLWDIAMIGAEPQRADKIAFTPAYAEIESTYLVPPGSPITAIEQVDRPGVRIAVYSRAAYGLWLERNIRHAELCGAESLDHSFEVFQNRHCDVLAGLRPRLVQDLEKLPGARILEGRFSSVQQAIGTPAVRGDAAVEFLTGLVAEMIRSGFVADRIRHHGVEGKLAAAQGT